ncbi:hypothetical protein ACFLV4_04785 [Chloroflexota bacterium]
MSKNAKSAIVGLIGGLGLVFLLIGALIHIYPATTGVIIMFACWLISGVLARYWGLKKEKGRKYEPNWSLLREIVL